MSARKNNIWIFALSAVVLFGIGCSGPDQAGSQTEAEEPGSAPESSHESNSHAPEQTVTAQEPPPAPKEELGEPPRIKSAQPSGSSE